MSKPVQMKTTHLPACVSVGVIVDNSIVGTALTMEICEVSGGSGRSCGMSLANFSAFSVGSRVWRIPCREARQFVWSCAYAV